MDIIDLLTGSIPLDRINEAFGNLRGQAEPGGGALPFAPQDGAPPPVPPQIPLPPPRPQTAPQLPPSGVPDGGPYNTGPGDPYTVAPKMWGPGAPNMAPPGPVSDIDQPSKRSYGILTALGMDPEHAASVKRSLAGGLSKVKSGTTAGESIAQSLGGSMTGGNNYEDAQDKRREGALDRAIKLKGQDELNDYRQGSLDRSNYGVAGQTQDGKGVYFDRRNGTEKVGGQVLAPKAGAGGRGGGVTQWKYDAWMKANPGDEKGALDYASGQKKLGEPDINRLSAIAARDDLRGNPAMASRPQAEKDAYLKERMDFWRQQHRQGAAPAPAPAQPGGAPAPAAPGRSGVIAPAGVGDEPPMISMKGAGGQTDPYQPQSPDDYNEIPPGAYYQHPNDPPGKLRLKK